MAKFTPQTLQTIIYIFPNDPYDSAYSRVWLDASVKLSWLYFIIMWKDRDVIISSLFKSNLVTTSAAAALCRRSGWKLNIIAKKIYKGNKVTSKQCLPQLVCNTPAAFPKPSYTCSLCTSYGQLAIFLHRQRWAPSVFHFKFSSHALVTFISLYYTSTVWDTID